MSDTPTPTNPNEQEAKLDKILDRFMTEAPAGTVRLTWSSQDTRKEIKAALLAWAASQRKSWVQQAEIQLIEQISTGGRPLSAPPLIVRQPVPCPRCGAEEYADWTLYPHQLYNSYMPGGIGHYCFSCFAFLASAKEWTQQAVEAGPKDYNLSTLDDPYVERPFEWGYNQSSAAWRTVILSIGEGGKDA